jgi:hypothetical protein
MMNEQSPVVIEERVVLQKFDGDALPENEVERLTILDGTVVEHDIIQDGEVMGPVEEDNLTGNYVGSLYNEGGRLP